MNVDPAAPVAGGEPVEGPVLVTERLRLRRWQAADNDPFAVLNADPVVMEFFPRVLTRAGSDLMARFADGLFGRFGYGLWAVETLEDHRFIGFVGLSAVGPDDPLPDRSFPFAPAVEVGWRLSRDVWGRGYAPEAAVECLRFGFETVGLAEIVSFTSEINLRSRRVMEKIGMHRDPGDDFDHPRIPAADRLRRHVLYRLRREEWETAPLRHIGHAHGLTSERAEHTDRAAAAATT